MGNSMPAFLVAYVYGHEEKINSQQFSRDTAKVADTHTTKPQSKENWLLHTNHAAA